MPKTKTTPKRKVGRPGWSPSDKDLDQIEALAQRGLPKGKIAAYFNFHFTYWCDLEKKFPEISERQNKGYGIGHAKAFSKLWEHIYVKNSERALFYYLDRICGLSKDGVSLQIHNTTNHVTNNNTQINIKEMNMQDLKILAQQSLEKLGSDYARQIPNPKPTKSTGD